ncbi:hypothetical protein RhoFasSB10_05008 [Rhodococcus fascians]|nr:hypothetical protein [Rhodococcus fascians]
MSEGPCDLGALALSTGEGVPASGGFRRHGGVGECLFDRGVVGGCVSAEDAVVGDAAKAYDVADGDVDVGVGVLVDHRYAAGDAATTLGAQVLSVEQHVAAVGCHDAGEDS